MKTGLLNDVVTIQRLRPMPDGVYGTAKQGWEDVMTLRATIDYRGGDRVVENYEVVNTHLVKITTHLRRTIEPQMRVKCADGVYYIQSRYHDRRNGQTIMMCELINE
jgi:head-tail adaptor